MKCGCDPHVEWCPECRKEIQEREDRYKGWVKCSERNPDTSDGYIVAIHASGDPTKELVVRGMNWSSQGWTWEDIDEVVEPEWCPVAWMPFPAPPKTFEQVIHEYCENHFLNPKP